MKRLAHAIWALYALLIVVGMSSMLIPWWAVTMATCAVIICVPLVVLGPSGLREVWNCGRRDAAETKPW
jgi:hypothetical protein